MHLDLGHRAADVLVQFQPELAGVGLGLGDRRPIVANMLVLAGNLATVAAVTNIYIDNKGFH